jgi:hypothetical protein
MKRGDSEGVVRSSFDGEARSLFRRRTAGSDLGGPDFAEGREVAVASTNAVTVDPAGDATLGNGRGAKRQSVGLDYIISCGPGCDTLIGREIDANGNIVNPVRQERDVDRGLSSDTAGCVVEIAARATQTRQGGISISRPDYQILRSSDVRLSTEWLYQGRSTAMTKIGDASLESGPCRDWPCRCSSCLAHRPLHNGRRRSTQPSALEPAPCRLIPTS